MVRLLVFVVTVVFLLSPTVLLARGGHGKGHKGPSSKAYEHANENARFKRDDDWVENLGGNKSKEAKEKRKADKELEREKHKKLKIEEMENEEYEKNKHKEWKKRKEEHKNEQHQMMEGNQEKLKSHPGKGPTPRKKQVKRQ